MKISDLCISTCSGGTPKRTEPLYYEDGTIPWLTTSEVNFKDIYLTQNKITELGYKKSSATIIPINSVIVAMYGVTAGRVAVNKIELTTNQACCNLIIDDKKANYRYVYYYLMMQSKELNRLANGGAQQNLNSIVIKKYKILIPKKIEIQNRISNLLYNYDKLIENNNHRIKLLETMAEELYKEWFVRFKFPGYKKAKFENGIPKNWEYKKFSDICNYIRGISYSSEEIESNYAENILINLKNIKDYGGFRKENFKTYDGDYKEEQVVSKFNLVMALTEMVQERRIIGYVGLIPSYDGNCVISADLMKIISDIDNLFLYSMFIYGGYSLYFSQYGNGTNVIHLKPTSLRNIKLLIPSKELIDLYVNIVKDYFEMIDKLQLENEMLTEQRDYLLPRLMSGKLSVENKNII